MQFLLAANDGLMVNPGVCRGEVDVFTDRQSKEIHVGELLRGNAGQRRKHPGIGQRERIGNETVRAQTEEIAQFYERLGR